MSKLKRKKVKSKRIFILGLLFSVVFIAIVSRLGYVMIVDGSDYKQLALNQWTKTIKMAPKRGTILSKNGSELALSTDVYKVDVDLNVLKIYLTNKKIPQKQVVAQLSEKLNIETSEVQKKLNSKDSKGNLLQFVFLKRKVGKAAVDDIKALKYNGIIISNDVDRVYSNDNFLSQVIGHSNSEGNGISGVEQSYNNELAGVPGVKVAQVDRNNNELPYTEATTVKPVDGKNLTLTIDERIQELAETVAKQTLAENGAKSVSITIMDPQNGEILAMANAPGYNPNKPYEIGKTDGETQEIWKNRAVSNMFEPGSIFKVITAAAALKNNLVTEQDRFVSDGSIRVGNTTLYNDNKEDYGVETFSDIIRNSDNVAFVKLGQKIGKENLYKFIKDAGFGQKTGIDLPGESTGLIKDFKSIGPVDFATMAYGQGIAVTQTQYISAFNAIANGGTWIRPHVMKDISHMVSGKKIVDKQYGNLDKRNIISNENAAQLRTYLESVVKEGTAVDTYIKGYHIAGKTGTANVVNNTTGGYESGKYIASFAGMAPASNPKVTLIVTVEEPNSEKYYAAQTAVPAARKLFSGLFTILNIPPDTK
ncbi:penicillin-binding protein 2 [Clostridium bowmanii]|uniref:penicillin-binding transpeptidase domain-containing protein n=1 Tax=Clostridium bowmanii TaxID=132925 RepID=UPI001C0CD32F|nr:penicillin-binding transpeptidase domain-containing protein [Clostridium bowmanii]MBU3190462.1 penicillin-binding protein 2 [Clostridium bowmanii]MCA1074476.1 penicillin-binding protein 2 [Clostridium bowmanii]